MEVVKDGKEKVIQNEVALREAAKGIYAINRGGYDLNCPHQPPMRVIKQQAVALSGTAPQAEIVHAPCMSTCPLFMMKENEDGTIDVKIGCGHIVYEKTSMIKN